MCFGDQGVFVVRYADTVTAVSIMSSFGSETSGWNVNRHPRLIACTTGSKMGDIVGFGGHSVCVSINSGNDSFQPPKDVLRNFGHNAGWRIEKHPRFLVDLRKTGRADIIGFGNDGVLVSLNDGDGNFGPPSLVVNDFGYNFGWRLENHPRFLADTTGDGFPDIIGFGEQDVMISLSKHDGTFHPPVPVLQMFCQSLGSWRVDKHPRFVADLTGNGCVDIIGFGNNGVHVALNNGNGTFQAARLVLDNFGYAVGGWRVEKHPRFIADITGDGRGDIVGFGEDGVYVSINNGDGTLKPSKLVVTDFGYKSGWRVEKHPRFMTDLTGNGCADIVGFGDGGIYASLNDGCGNFGPTQKIFANFGYDAGWRMEKDIRIPAKMTY